MENNQSKTVRSIALTTSHKNLFLTTVMSMFVWLTVKEAFTNQPHNAFLHLKDSYVRICKNNIKK